MWRISTGELALLIIGSFVAGAVVAGFLSRLVRGRGKPSPAAQPVPVPSESEVVLTKRELTALVKSQVVSALKEKELGAQPEPIEPPELTKLSVEEVVDAIPESITAEKEEEVPEKGEDS
ncbi:MAG: hypothetical protein ISS36_00705 [Candidatus Aenigmarchaeota archaeon]|nr:hypothetical protein [Candidatus Aenigmarchaeota archaeon]